MKAEIAARQDRQLLLFDLTVVLRVEDVVDGRQTDVLVAAAVAGDEVAVEQLVVVVECWPGRGLIAMALPASVSASAPRTPPTITGAALCAMSSRKAWPVRTAPVQDRASAEMTPYGVDRGSGVPVTDDVVSRVRDAVRTDAEDHLRQAVRRRG